MRYFYSFEDERVFSLYDINAIWNSFTAEEKAEYNNSMNDFICGGLEYGLEEVTHIKSDGDPDLFYFEITEDNGKKELHLWGNLYYNDGGAKFQLDEWCHFYIPIEKLPKTATEFYNLVCEEIQYIEDLPNEIEMQKSYIAIKHNTKNIRYTDININTPCGKYNFEF